MRLAVDTAIALMLTLLLGGVIWYHMRGNSQIHQVEAVRHALAQVREKSLLASALGEVDVTETGFPKYPLPEWFKEGIPANTLVGPHHPWVDLAPPGDTSDHPPDPVVKSREQAGLWYNPNNGICRARVVAQFTERETLDLYNLVNGTMLAALPASRHDPHEPLPHPMVDRIREIRLAQRQAQREPPPEPPDPASPASRVAATDAPASQTPVEPAPDPDPEPSTRAPDPRPTLLRE